MAWLALNKNGTVYVTTEIHKKYLRYPVLGLSAHRDYIYKPPFSYSPKQPFIFSFGCAPSFYSWLSTRKAPLLRFAGKAGFRHFPFSCSSFL